MAEFGNATTVFVAGSGLKVGSETMFAVSCGSSKLVPVGAGSRVWAYVDETGDRGSGPNASPIFGMAAVLVNDVGAVELRRAVQRLRTDFKVPAGKVMSWKEHVKNHDRRRHAADVLSGVSDLKVCYVFAVKSELDPVSYVSNPQLFYNYLAFQMYKSISWAARNWYGKSTQLWTRFGHVRNHDHTSTEQYIRAQAAQDYRVPFYMEQALNWVSADRYLESQAADLYAGFLKSAIWPSGEFGQVEPAYLLKVWSQIRNSEECVVPLGMFPMPRREIAFEMVWFPCSECPKRTRAVESLHGPIQ